METKVYKIVKISALKDGKMGVSIERAQRIKRALKWITIQKGMVN